MQIQRKTGDTWTTVKTTKTAGNTATFSETLTGQPGGNQTASQKFKGIKAAHDLNPKPGDKICPITLTKANPGYTWVIGGKEYQFCCPPCVEEYVTLAKKDPTALKPPDAFIKK